LLSRYFKHLGELLMGKLGAIRSADVFGTASVLQNKFAHHYPRGSTWWWKRLIL